MKIQLAVTDEEINSCFPAMQELRPFLTSEDFVPRVRRLMSGGFQLVYVQTDGKVPAVGGFRICEMLHRGKSIYLDDLSTMESHRSEGFGGKIIDWLMELAKKEGCYSFHLDSGVQRFDAHRFYLRKKFNITSHHFEIKLKAIE
ncbi:MAG: GNAT family N-acetyltransferase [Bacteroidota bacterium]|nr:GNAT family N-acetyltransferase [Bacteroidota bacterium]